ncbi:MAG TPA: glycosyltransferase [Methanofastidiosum sp.]|nr:glycosyltransferase [Methanofastidiosum sp.]
MKSDTKLVYCLMTWNRHCEVIQCVQNVRPHVDRVVVVDAGSEDDTIIYLRNRGDVELYITEWKDNFSELRNKYLEKVDTGDWVLVSDPDEWFLPATLQALRQLVEKGEKENIHMFGFQCVSVTLRGDVVVSRNLDTYWKGLLFKKFEDTKYVNSPHETLVYQNGRGYELARTPYLYTHVKQENVIWKRGARNFFIGGGGPNLGERNAIWKPFRELVKQKTGINTWDEFNKYLLRGNIDEEIKKWIMEHAAEGLKKGEQNYDGSSEVREVAKLYYLIYHPEELELDKIPEEVKEEYKNVLKIEGGE